jgi:hypothetical protein
MHHSERLALRSLLESLRPRCALAIGADDGGSLSLIAQYARVVFSVCMEPAPADVRVFPNASFLSGPPGGALPVLLDELREQDLAPEFVLLHGDEGREGVSRDLEILLGRPTRCPMWIVMYNSVDPARRSGMRDAAWEANPQVHFVDLDFIPGRVVEHGGSGDGELRGGLGVACLLPEHRQGPLNVQQTARRTTQILQHAWADSEPRIYPDAGCQTPRSKAA